MRKIWNLYLALGLIFTVSQTNLYAKEGHGNLTVKITNLKNSNGNVRVAIYNSKEAYDAEKGAGDAEKSCAKTSIKIKSQEAQYTFEELAYGDYALKFFHDEDESGKFYKNFMGIPKVEYGFSNNAKGHFGPASYEQATFRLDKPSTEMNLQAQ